MSFMITMSQKELHRLDVIQKIRDQRLSVVQAAELLDLSRSQVHRLLRAYDRDGPTGLVSKKRTQPSNRRHSEEFRNAALDLIRERYLDFGPTLAREKPRDGLIPLDYRISQRPDFIGDRSQFWHWEGDLLIFRRELGETNVTSLVERKSRYTVMIKNRSRHSRPIMDKIIDAFSPLPAFARQSFTFDRGTEFRGFRALENGIGARSWFCDPNSPWQKGAVENTNKRIRRFMPGDTDLSNVAQQQLVDLAHHLNSLPRKCLGYKTPAEVFMAHLRECG
ncbi:IS30 family transposase [Rhizobium sp. BK060]|nr:IS30 family transposase [Rhizobium sp. BK060]